MRPTIQEQLAGTCRVLEGVVAPRIADPFARTMLAGLIANLRMLTGALPALAGFLRHDNQATAILLAALRDAVAPDLAARIDEVMRLAEPDVADGAALEARNTLLRELLALAVRTESLSPESHRAIVQHMTLRASRVPMRYVSTVPPPPNTEKP